MTIEALNKESGSKPLGTVRLECHYPVVALALKEILKDEADVLYEEHKSKPSGTEDPTSLIILCPNGKDMASEVRRLRASNPNVAVLVFEMRRLDQQLALKALRAGASGLLHAGMRPEQIVGAVRQAYEGKAVIPQKLSEKPIGQAIEGADPSVLTPRQREIVDLVCEGLSNAEIAERLFLTESTVKQHLYAAYKLLKVRNRTQAAKLLRDA